MHLQFSMIMFCCNSGDKDLVDLCNPGNYFHISIISIHSSANFDADCIFLARKFVFKSCIFLVSNKPTTVQALTDHMVTAHVVSDHGTRKEPKTLVGLKEQICLHNLDLQK